MENFIIDASQGTHFFHNLLSMNVGYFNIKYKSQEDFIDWEWLKECDKLMDLEYCALVRYNKSLTVKMDGKKGVAGIWK